MEDGKRWSQTLTKQKTDALTAVADVLVEEVCSVWELFLVIN